MSDENSYLSGISGISIAGASLLPFSKESILVLHVASTATPHSLDLLREKFAPYYNEVIAVPNDVALSVLEPRNF